MPAIKHTTKTYGGTIPAPIGAIIGNLEVASFNPKRTLLLVQNTGAGDLLLRFGGPVLNDGSDIVFTAGASAGLLFDRASTCPEASINLGSVAGTTFSITEQITQ